MLFVRFLSMKRSISEIFVEKRTSEQPYQPLSFFSHKLSLMDVILQKLQLNFITKSCLEDVFSHRATSLKISMSYTLQNTSYSHFLFFSATFLHKLSYYYSIYAPLTCFELVLILTNQN